MHFPDGIALAIEVGTIDKRRPLIEEEVERTNDTVVPESESVLFLFVNLIANIALALLNKQDLVDFIQFVVDYLPSLNK